MTGRALETFGIRPPLHPAQAVLSRSWKSDHLSAGKRLLPLPGLLLGELPADTGSNRACGTFYLKILFVFLFFSFKFSLLYFLLLVLFLDFINVGAYLY